MDKISLSKEERTRADIWVSVLQKTCNNLAVCAKIYKEYESIFGKAFEDNFGEYHVGGQPISYHTSSVIEKALVEASLVGLFSVIYGSGREGEGVAANQTENLKKLEDLMIGRAASKLEYSSEQVFREYLRKQLCIRNEVVAHYDGSKASFNDDDPLLVSMKMPSATFPPDEVLQLRDTAISLLESLQELLRELSEP